MRLNKLNQRQFYNQETVHKHQDTERCMTDDVQCPWSGWVIAPCLYVMKEMAQAPKAKEASCHADLATERPDLGSDTETHQPLLERDHTACITVSTHGLKQATSYYTITLQHKLTIQQPLLPSLEQFPFAKLWLGSLTVTCRTCNPEVTQGRRFDSAPGHCRVTTSGKLFTRMCLSHQAV